MASGDANVKVGGSATTGAEGVVRLVEYEDERQLSDIMSLVDRDLSEPYSIFTYRYFLHNWPGLCFVVRKAPAVIIILRSRIFVHAAVCADL